MDTTSDNPSADVPRMWTFPTIMLLDGVGALVTAFSVGVLLPFFQVWFGLPVAVLRVLGAVAALFAIYSLSRHFSGRTSAISLRRIAAANLTYCCVTAAMLLTYAGDVTRFAVAYFVGEIAIVVVLSMRELSLARQHG